MRQSPSNNTEVIKNDFVGMVSHELRSPLTSIQAAVKLVSAGILGAVTPDQKSALDLALRNVERMGRMVNQLLDITKVETGRLELRREPVDLVQLTHDVVRSFEPLAQERSLNLTFYSEQPSIDIYVDRDKITQVFTNLLHNALKFTAEGDISVTLRRHEAKVHCEVSDTGPGFNKKDLAKVFEKFKRFDTPARGGEKGTGLGLALTRRLIELHEGEIHVESEAGKGSHFIFTLPILRPDDLFEQAVDRFINQARADGQALSLIQLRIHDWDWMSKQLGEEAAHTVLNYFESLMRTLLRDDSDFVVQSQGALWLAVFSVDRQEAARIAQRIEKNFHRDLIGPVTNLPLQVALHLACYPDDGQTAAQLLSVLQAVHP